MNYRRKLHLISALCIFGLLALACGYHHNETQKISGVCFTGPPAVPSDTCMLPLQRLGAGWVAILPYGYSKSGEPNVNFDVSWQWWGERRLGVEGLIGRARKAGLKVMLKPQVWVMGQGWTGDFDPGDEAKWKIWEEEYARYILSYARIAADLKVELFCIGTEFRQASGARPEFWRALIAAVREAYDGPLTYSANWDEYGQIKFWDALDYIGVNAYFPLSDSPNPSHDMLIEAWQEPANEMKKLAKTLNKPVLFTEFGYKSVDHAAGKQWLIQQSNPPGAINLGLQSRAYQAIFEMFWSQDWFAGGFLWKWYHHHASSGGEENKDYTPQNKPAARIIQKYYRR